MELDWTMLPMQPSAMMMAMEKNTASGTEFFAQSLGDVISGTANNVTVMLKILIGLCKHGLSKNCCHAEEGRNPKPEK